MSDVGVLTVAVFIAYLVGLAGLLLCSLEPGTKRNSYYWTVMLLWPAFVLVGMFYSLLESRNGMVGRVGVDDHGQ